MRFLFAASLIVATLPALAAPACPALAGRYRILGSGPAMVEARQALALDGTFGDAVDLVIEATPDGRVLTLSQRLPTDPDRWLGARRTLSQGAEFVCADGSVVLGRRVPASRRTEAAYLEGHTELRLRPGGGGALALELRFQGGERSTLYAYDSARVSVPKPFTGRTLVDTLSWPPSADTPLPPPPRSAVAERAQRAVEQADDALRSRLRELIGRSMLGVIRDEPGGLRVQLRAMRTEDVVDTEDRLMASGLAFEVAREPQWYNGAHHSEILVRPGLGGPERRPSAFRVTVELDSLLASSGHVVKAKRDGDGYVVLVDLLRGTSPADALRRVNGRGRVVGAVTPDGQERDYGYSAERLLERWRVTLRR